MNDELLKQAIEDAMGPREVCACCCEDAKEGAMSNAIHNLQDAGWHVVRPGPGWLLVRDPFEAFPEQL